MKNNAKTNKSAVTDNCVYHSIEEFRQKYFPESTSYEVVSTEEEAKELGAQMARESLKNIKFDLLIQSV